MRSDLPLIYELANQSLQATVVPRAPELHVGARVFSRLISLPFNYLYCILVVKIGEMALKNGK